MAGQGRSKRAQRRERARRGGADQAMPVTGAAGSATGAVAGAGAGPPGAGRQAWPRLSPLARRRLANFRANARGYWSLWLFLALFGISLLANVVANEAPLMVSYQGRLYFPIVKSYPETDFGGIFETTAEFRDPAVQQLVGDAGGWILWPPIRYSYDTVLKELPQPLPTPPSWAMTAEKRCAGYATGVADPNCTIGNWNWMGTDDHGRDVLARIIYGVRLSVIFGLLLTVLSSLVGIAAGAVQGYYGGRVDLTFQRFIEIWTSIPELYVLLIIASVLSQGFLTLLGILLLFSWVELVAVVRAEFLRGRNFEYVRAARALGLSDVRIMLKHILPNAMVATVTFMPFILSGSITSLTALDYLGIGLPVGYPSLGELLKQGKANINAPWLGFTAFVVISVLLSLLVFVGEAVRDALDPRKSIA